MNHFDSIKRPNNIFKNIIFYKDKTALEYPLKAHIDSLRRFKNHGDSQSLPQISILIPAGQTRIIM